VVILLHNCAGIDGSPSLAVWAPLMWAQGYATLRFDSFTARGYSNVCNNPSEVRVGERAQDVFAAASLLTARPDVRPDRIAVLGLSHGGGTAIYVARDTRSCVLGASSLRHGTESSWRVSLCMAAVGQTLATRS